MKARRVLTQPYQIEGWTDTVLAQLRVETGKTDGRETINSFKIIESLVGAGRFERPTPCAQGRCATRLRYAPTSTGLFILNHFPTSRYCPVYPTEAKRAPTVAKP